MAAMFSKPPKPKTDQRSAADLEEERTAKEAAKKAMAGLTGAKRESTSNIMMSRSSAQARPSAQPQAAPSAKLG